MPSACAALVACLLVARCGSVGVELLARFKPTPTG
jgi:hypothetical protein